MKDYMKEQYRTYAKALIEEAQTHIDKANEASTGNKEAFMELNKALTLLAAAGEFAMLMEEKNPIKYYFRRRKMNSVLKIRMEEP